METRRIRLVIGMNAPGQNANRLDGLQPEAPVVISVCITCRADASTDSPRPGAQLRDELNRILEGQTQGVVVRSVQCLGVCKRPATVAVSAANGYTFVFGDLDPQNGPVAIADFARLFQAADYGFVPWAQRPEVLRTRLVARIPSVTWSPPDGRPPG
jgi:predicted metal-binding protein